MSEAPRSEADFSFARELAEEFNRSLLAVSPPGFGVAFDMKAGRLLRALEARVARYLGEGPSFLSPRLDRVFSYEITLASRLLATGRSGVLMLREAGNGFGLGVIVDVYNESARRGLLHWRSHPYGDDDDAPPAPIPPAPPLNSQWLSDIESGAAPVETVGRSVASVSFLTLLTDALRLALPRRGISSNPPVFTASSNRRGWILEAWPQFNYSPTRFGQNPTSPVTDTLPAFGNYMFQGLKGSSISRDTTPHYFGPSRTSTVVKL